VKIGFLAVGLMAALAAVGCGRASMPATTTARQRPATPVPGRPVPASAIHRLTVMANRAIKINAGHGVAWASVVVTTRAKALTSATPGDLIPHGKQTVVYLVTIKGHFVAEGASPPLGGKAPRGTYLSAVISAKTFEGLDFGLSPKAPPVDPASLGPPTFLKVRKTASRR
jgi:hypothetical protein